MSDARPISDTLADFAFNLTFEKIPAPVIRDAKHLFLDAIGVAFASSRIACVRLEGRPGSFAFVPESDILVELSDEGIGDVKGHHEKEDKAWESKAGL